MIVFLKFILLFAFTVCTAGYVKVDQQVSKIIDKHPLAELKVDTAAIIGIVIFPAKKKISVLAENKVPAKHKLPATKKKKEEKKISPLVSSVAIQPESVFVPDPEKKDSIVPPYVRIKSKIVVKKSDND